MVSRAGQAAAAEAKFDRGAFRSASKRGAPIAEIEVLGSRQREFRPGRRSSRRLVFVVYVKRAPRRETEGVTDSWSCFKVVPRVCQCDRFTCRVQCQGT